MSYRYLEDTALADVAFEATSSSVEGLFAEAAKALFDTMVALESVSMTEKREITLSAKALDLLLFDWLAELILIKDTEHLLFREFEVEIRPPEKPARKYMLAATAVGERMDFKRHSLRTDVKAVTMHDLSLDVAPGRCRATVVLDI